MSSVNGDDLGDLLGDLEAGMLIIYIPGLRYTVCHTDGARGKASKVPAKRRKTPVRSTVESIASVLYDRGALPEELVRLVDLVTVRNHLDQASLGSIIRSLYPVGSVDDETVLRVVGALGHGELKPSLALQGLLLRWLIMVYHLLKNTVILSRTYSVLFNLLDTAAIRYMPYSPRKSAHTFVLTCAPHRPQLCHLLALVTRRKHVRPFRIQAM